jgi:hypothetical protein
MNRAGPLGHSGFDRIRRGQSFGVKGASPGPAGRTRIVKTVDPLLVAEQGRRYRRKIQNAVPETIG